MRFRARCTFTLLLVMFHSVLLWTGCGQEEPQEKIFVRPVKAVKVSNVTDFRKQWFPGRAKAHQAVDLSFRIGGPLISRPVDVGDRVKKGRFVARIDPRDFEVNVRNAQGRLDRVKAVLTRAVSDFRRINNIIREDPGAASETLLDQKREALDAAKAEVRSLKATLDTAKDQLSYTYLRDPFDGTVVATYVENFETVRRKQRIARILDTARIEMIVDIPENLIALAPYVTNIIVEFDAFPDRQVPAKIYEIGTEASQATRTYPVTIIMDQPKDFTILPGMAGKTTGDANPPDNLTNEFGFTIPVGTVFSLDTTGATYVWVIAEETMMVNRREVKTSELQDGGILIIEGLEVGEWVVTAGVHSLREGQQVKFLEDVVEQNG